MDDSIGQAESRERVSPTAEAYAAARAAGAAAAVRGKVPPEVGESLLDLLRPPKAGPWPWVRVRQLREWIGLRRYEMDALVTRLKLAKVLRVRGDWKMEVALTRSAVGLEKDRGRPHVLDILPTSCFRVWEVLVSHVGPEQQVRLSMRRLARESGVSATQCRRALRRMVGARILAVVETGKGTRSTTYGIRWGGVGGPRPALPPATERVLKALGDLGLDGRAHVRDLAARLGITERQTRTHLARLAGAGIVEWKRGWAMLREVRKSSAPPTTGHVPRGKPPSLSLTDHEGSAKALPSYGPANVTGGSEPPQLGPTPISDAQVRKVAAELRKQASSVPWPPRDVIRAVVGAMIAELQKTRPALSFDEIPQLYGYLVASLGGISSRSVGVIKKALEGGTPPRRAYGIAAAAVKEAVVRIEAARSTG